MKKILSLVLPILAPIPTAWVAGTSLYNVLKFPVIVAIVAALVVELVGFGGVTTAQRMTEHNKHCKANEKAYRVPVWQAWAVIGIYLFAITALTVLVEFIAGAVKFAVLTFPLLGLSGFWLATLNSGIDRQERDKQQARDNKPARLVKATPKKQHKAQVKITDKQLQDFWLANPGAGNAETGRAFCVSGEAIRQRRAKLLQSV